ncbi:hypothetical protein KRR38_04215 [Novosphingobium sp. G106]|uniref:hypothetical protein n=1 Tax=Novosphingobium sp. G106 TaxID=2849500 RepID=UPI001C2CD904|nr:hypothetical protein [Novosphingobium sp. G106]MBV1686898.1 hypothetical protein [Novosphingobium sp. G106]
MSLSQLLQRLQRFRRCSQIGVLERFLHGVECTFTEGSGRFGRQVDQARESILRVLDVAAIDRGDERSEIRLPLGRAVGLRCGSLSNGDGHDQFTLLT